MTACKHLRHNKSYRCECLLSFNLLCFTPAFWDPEFFQLHFTHSCKTSCCHTSCFINFLESFDLASLPVTRTLSQSVLITLLKVLRPKVKYQKKLIHSWTHKHKSTQTTLTMTSITLFFYRWDHQGLERWGLCRKNTSKHGHWMTFHF